jgi:hypothetical protein
MRGDQDTLFKVKPAVGFTLPSAGVTPALSTNRKMARTPFCSEVLLGRRWGSFTSPVIFTGEAAGAAGR